MDVSIDRFLQSNYIEVKKVRDFELLNQLKEILDEGEAEAITLAKELKADYLLIDEIKGRNVAGKYNIKVIGLLGILINAKQKGLIDDVKNLMDQLINKAGFWIDSDLYNEVLRISKE